jgi:D-alanine-D-alanine ligase
VEFTVSLKIAVLLGGTSAERDVSLVTGRGIAKALSDKGHRVTAIDCAFGDQVITDWEVDSNEIIRVDHSDIEKRKAELDKNLLKTLDYLIQEKFDVTFIALHGGYGENGQLQAGLDLIKMPYTGSQALSSGLGMDKNLSKILFQDVGVPTAPWLLITRETAFDKKAIENLGLPVVIKPNDQGSTVGLTIVKKAEEMEPAIEKAFRFGKTVLAEKFIPGREMTVSMLDGKPLPVIEIIPEHGIYDYECKYQKGKSQYVVPAQISETVTESLQNFAIKAYQVLDCRHYARVDFRLQDNTLPFCLEVNTLPGMTPTSLVPKAAKAMGISFPDLVEKITYLAIQGE